jgi:hypothetical protein
MTSGLQELVQRARTQTADVLQTARSLAGSSARRAELASLGARIHSALDVHMQRYLTSSDETKRLQSSIECRIGCAHCCHLNVAVTIPEAFGVAGAIRATGRDDLAARVQTTASDIADLSAQERGARYIPCPMLSDNRCVLYEHRHGACRAYLSLSVQACADKSDNVPALAAPRALLEAISNGVELASADHGLQACAVELTGAVALILRDDTVHDRWLAGERVFAPYA